MVEFRDFEHKTARNSEIICTFASDFVRKRKMKDLERQRLASSGGAEKDIKTPELSGAIFSPSPTFV